MVGEFLQALLVEQAREKRQRGLPGRLAQDGNRYGEQTLGIVEAGDVAHAAGGVVAQDPVVGGDQRHPEHQRDGKLHPFAKRGIRHVERRTVSGADAGGADHAGQERPRNTSRQRAIGQRGNPEMPSAHHSSGNDEHVVEQRPECR